MPMNTAALIPVAQEAVDVAARIVRTRGTGNATEKGDRDMVTDTDLAVERAVRAHLHQATPWIGFLGEEHGATGVRGDLTWVLDPVDGTANLVHDLPLYAVSLALVDERIPVLGVIHVPFTGARYSAVAGHGAFRDGRRISASRATELSQAIIALGDYAVGAGADVRNQSRLAVTAQLAARAQRVRMLGSAAIDLTWVAEGTLDGCVALSNKPWDTAAGVLLAREAGAAVVDVDGTNHTLDSTATLAAPPTLIVQLTSLVHQAIAKSDLAPG